jgi:hypothetical protein
MRRITSVLLLILVLVATSSALGADPRGSRGNPYPIGTMVELPSAQGWKLRVNKSIPNATRRVMKWNKFNAPPRAGRQFFLINITLAYFGPGVDSPFDPARFRPIGKSNFPYSLADRGANLCGGIPGALNFGKKVSSGGRLTGNICFSVYKNDARSLLLIYQATLSPAIDKTPVFFKVR